jgi:hypothetical protein
MNHKRIDKTLSFAAAHAHAKMQYSKCNHGSF